MNPILQNLNVRYREVILYAIFGLLAIIVDTIVFLVSYNQFNINENISLVIGITIASFVNFPLNYHFTFKVKRNFFIQYFASYSIVFFGLVLSGIIFFIMVTILDVDPNITKIISIPPVVITQFFLNKYLAFSKRLFNRGGIVIQKES